MTDASARFLSTWFIVGLGLGVRFITYYYLEDFFKPSPQFVTPANSFKRFEEAVFLDDLGVNLYDGDMIHVMPIFIHLIRPFIKSPYVIRIFWMCFDLSTAFFLSAFVYNYIVGQKDGNSKRAAVLQNFALLQYLLNPMTIGSCTALSFSALTNLLVAAFVYTLQKNSVVLSALSLALAVHLNVYYVVLLASFALHFSARWPTAVAVGAASFALPLAANLALCSDAGALLRSTFGFYFFVSDLTPNCGLFWYFFAQIFEHYQLLFLFTFQINVFIYLVPLMTTLRNNVPFLTVSLIMSVSILSSYPSYAEAALYLPMIFAFVDFHKYIRYTLITGATLVTCTVLMPVMWRMWVVTGTGNANFFFAIVCVYALAQIFLFCDMASAYLRAQMIRECGLEKRENEIEQLKFVEPALF